MATKIRGITIELGADTSGINKALVDVNKEIGTTQRQLKDVERLLKLDPTNTELLEQKQRLLGDRVEQTKNKLDSLKKAQEQVGAELEKTGEGQEQYDALQREIFSCEQELKNLEKAANSSNVSLQKIKATADKVADVSGNISRKMAPATAALTALGVGAVKSASDLNESQNKVDVAFKDSSKQVHDWAETTLDSYGIAKGTALDMAALFGDMSTSMGLSTDEAANMSTSLVGLAGDLASFKNIGIDQATTALKGVFTGETESLKNLGIVMTQTNLDAYALANGFGKTTKDMTESEKVMLRYQYVMEKTANAQGDFANTSDGTANSLRVMQESTKELSAEFGEALLPVITPIIQKITELIKSFGDLSDSQKKTILVVLAVVAAISPVAGIISGLATIISTAIPIIGALGGTLGALAGPIGVAVLAIGLIATKGDWLQEKLQQLDNFLQNVFAKDWTQVFGPVLGGIINNFMSMFKSQWDAIKKVLDGIIDFIRGVFTGDWQRAWEGLKKIFGGVFDSLINLAKSPINRIITMINGLFSGINSVASKVGASISIPTIPMLAKGGVVTSGSAIVGEAGAELLSVSNGAATVQPLTSSSGSAGHTDITDLLSTYLPYLAAGNQIVLDTGVLVGETAPAMNTALGRISVRANSR